MYSFNMYENIQFLKVLVEKFTIDAFLADFFFTFVKFYRDAAINNWIVNPNY